MIKQITDQSEWNNHVNQSYGHPLQLWEWGEVKSRHGWAADHVELQAHPWVGAQILIRTLPAPFRSFAYVPRGPVGEYGEHSLAELAQYIQQTHGSVAVSIEPQSTVWKHEKGWKKTSNTVLAPRTIILDISQPESELLAHMTKKTRQYIRKSERSGISIRKATSIEDVKRCLDVYKQTAHRAHFSLHDDSYYIDIFELLGQYSPIYIAEYENQIVSFLWLGKSDYTAFELYGGVTDEGQSLRANYYLKWFAICDMKAQGVKEYDLNGLINDGISTFKTGFSDEETQLIGTYDRALSPLYKLWSKGLPAAKKIVRFVKR